MNSASDYKKSTEAERLEMSSGKSENQGNISLRDEHNKGEKRQISSRHWRDQEEMERRHKELYQKDLNELDYNGVASHPEPDLLERGLVGLR